MYVKTNNDLYNYYSKFEINPFLYSEIYSIEKNINVDEDSKIGANLFGIFDQGEKKICSIEIKNTKGFVRFNESLYIDLIRYTKKDTVLADGISEFIKHTRPELESLLTFNISNKNFFYDEYSNILNIVAECSPKAFEKVSIAKMFNSLPVEERVAKINALAQDIVKTGVFNPEKGTLALTVNASIREIQANTELALYNFRRVFPGKEFNLDVANNRSVYNSLINKALFAIQKPIVYQESPTNNNLLNIFKEMRGEK